MTTTLILLALGVVLGTMAQRLTGLGFALLMAPFFALSFGPYEGILLMNVGGAFSSLLVLSRVWRDVDWRRFGFLISAAIPGGIVGGLVVSMLESAALQILVGALLILTLSASLFVKTSARGVNVSTAALGAGLVSGFTNATAGTGSPPIVIYAQVTGWPQKYLAATLQPFFFAISVSAFGLKTFISGATPGLDWWIYPAMMVFILIGLRLGTAAKPFVREMVARRAVIIFCYAGATLALVDGVTRLVG